MCGLVSVASGELRWGRDVTAMYIPQTALRAPGASLAGHLTYPDTKRYSQTYLQKLLQQACVAHLFTRCPNGDMYAPIADGGTFSAGELQCLGLARVLHAHPTVAFLDEATSALPPDVELRVLNAIIEAGTTLVTASHSEALHAVHTHVLSLEPGSVPGWRIDPCVTSRSIIRGLSSIGAI